MSGNPALAALYASPDDPQLQFNVLQQAVGCALAMPKESRDASLPSPQALLNLLVDFAKAVKVPCVLPKNADFSGENCQNYLPDKVDFNGANLSGANLSGCTIDNFTNFSGAIMKNLMLQNLLRMLFVMRKVTLYRQCRSNPMYSGKNISNPHLKNAATIQPKISCT